MDMPSSSPLTRMKLDDCLFFALIFYLATFVFEALIRYELAQAHLENLLYFRDLIYGLSVAILAMRAILQRNQIHFGNSAIALVLLIHFIMGMLNGLALFSQLLAIKVFFPLLYGSAMWPIVSQRFTAFLLWMRFFFFASLLAVALQKIFGAMFWENQTYETAFGVSHTSRTWWTDGELRLAGVARTSFDAAVMIGLGAFSSLLLARKAWQRIIICILSLVGIFWTTTKGMLMVFFVLSLWFLFSNTRHRFTIGRAIASVYFVLAVSLPIIVVFYDLGNHGSVRTAPPFLSSLWDRFSWMWPNAFDLFNQSWQYLTGMGIGAIGTAQLFGPDYYRVNAGDNIFVYCFVTFGVMAAPYLAFPLFQTWYRPGGNDQRSIWQIGILLMTFGYGMTTNIIEEAFFCCMVGLCFGAAFSVIQKTEAGQPQLYSRRTIAL